MLRDRGQLCRVEQRVQVAADHALRGLAIDIQRDGPHGLGHGARHPLLVEHLAGYAIGVTFERERAVAHHRQDGRGHRHVVAEQLALRDSRVRPEDLVQVAELQTTPRDFQVTVVAGSLQSLEGLDQRR